MSGRVQIHNTRFVRYDIEDYFFNRRLFAVIVLIMSENESFVMIPAAELIGAKSDNVFRIGPKSLFFCYNVFADGKSGGMCEKIRKIKKSFSSSTMSSPLSPTLTPTSLKSLIFPSL